MRHLYSFGQPRLLSFLGVEGAILGLCHLDISADEMELRSFSIETKRVQLVVFEHPCHLEKSHA